MKRIGSVGDALSSECSAPDPSVMRWTEPAGSGPNGAADVVLVPEEALDHVGEALHVAVRVERPHGAGDEPVVVEHAHRAEAVVLRVAVVVEAEVPAGAEPATARVEDLAVATDGDHRFSPLL